MSKSSELDKAVKLYILSCINAENYQAQELITTEDKINFLRQTFISECDWNIKRIGRMKALQEWLQGLPSSLNIEFMNYKILELAILWGSLAENASEKQKNKILENYWNFMANKLNQLFDGYRIPKDLGE